MMLSMSFCIYNYFNRHWYQFGLNEDGCCVDDVSKNVKEFLLLIKTPLRKLYTGQRIFFQLTAIFAIYVSMYLFIERHIFKGSVCVR